MGYPFGGRQADVSPVGYCQYVTRSTSPCTVGLAQSRGTAFFQSALLKNPLPSVSLRFCLFIRYLYLYRLSRNGYRIYCSKSYSSHCHRNT